MTFLTPPLFFLLVSILFPLGLSVQKTVLQTMAADVIWIALLLAHLLSLPNLFSAEYDDGTLDQWVMRPHTLIPHIISKVTLHWFFLIFPVMLLMPILSLLYNLSFFTVNIVLLSLLFGAPLIVLQGAIVASLCVGLKRNSLLLAIILLPMYIPTMILGTTVVAAAQEGLPVLFQLDVLGALLILAMTFGPGVIAFALRVGITYG